MLSLKKNLVLYALKLRALRERLPADSGKHCLAVLIFGLFTWYTLAFEHDPALLEDAEVLSATASVAADALDVLSAEHRRLLRERAFSGLEGDWYRVGVVGSAHEAARVEVSIRSAIQRAAPIGSMEFPGGAQEAYREIVFRVPPGGEYTDFLFVLHNEGPGGRGFGAVTLSRFHVSRLALPDGIEAAGLERTLFGLPEKRWAAWQGVPSLSDPNILFEGAFRAETPFLEALVLNAREQPRNNGYALEIRRMNVVDESEKHTIKRVTLRPGELAGYTDTDGNQRVPLRVHVEPGREYMLILRGTGRASHALSLLALREQPVGGIGALLFSRHQEHGGRTLLTNARIEDFGQEKRYHYELSGTVSDLMDIAAFRGDIRYDEAARQVLVESKQGNSLTYRFDFGAAYETLALSAEHPVWAEGGVGLEYSFDGETWSRLEPSVEEEGRFAYAYVLPNAGQNDQLFIRLAYTGEDRKTGFFGLQGLRITAQLR